MTEKRFQWIYIKDNILELRDNGIVKVFNNERLEELLNKLADENENNKKLIELYYDDNNRLRNKNERLHKDFDKLYELCREHLTDEEIITELER